MIGYVLRIYVRGMEQWGRKTWHGVLFACAA